MKKTLLLMISFGSFFATNAQDKEEPKAKFAFSGYLDSYYFANLNKPASRNNLGASGTARAFDQKAGTFGLGLVQTKLTYTAANGKTDAVVDLAFGPNADLGNYGNLVGPLGQGTTALAIKQAYLNWKATEKLTLTAGQFGTHIGYEVIDAPINYNYSLSNLFNNGPFYHIGVKANLAISSKASIMAGIVNNIDALYDNNRAKALIGQLYFTPVSGWNVYVNGISTNDNAADAAGNTPEGNYSLLDLTTSYQISPKFLLGLNGAYGSKKPAAGAEKLNWSGVALYTNYAVSDVFSIGGRFESFNNSDGATLLVDGTKGVKMTSITITPTFNVPGGNLLIKPEFRIDSADSETFFEDDKGGMTKGSQSTVGLAFIYKF
jgi:hypothetical protein